MTRLRADDGSILPLVSAFAALALALILVVTAASSLYLDRKRLFAVADGAALAGAQSYDLDAIAFDGETVTARLDARAVRTAAQDFIAIAPRPLDDLRLDDAGTPDARTASVTVSGVWHPPIVGAFFPGGLRIDVTSVARTAFR